MAAAATPEFTEEKPNQGNIKEENQDLGFIDYNNYNIIVKEEDDGADFIQQSPCNDEIKEEIQDPDFTENDQNTSGIKEEEPGQDSFEQSRYEDDTKEEIRDPDHQSNDPSGPSDPQASKIVKDLSHPSNGLFSLLRSGKRFRSLKTNTERLRRSFFSQAIRALNQTANL